LSPLIFFPAGIRRKGEKPAAAGWGWISEALSGSPSLIYLKYITKRGFIFLRRLIKYRRIEDKDNINPREGNK